MRLPTVIEQSGQRVLTTAQLAEAYGTVEKAIRSNFANNKSRYIESIHFYCLTGSDLKLFKSETENLGVAIPANVNVFYLWTERGALLHAKSLNTDKAWEVYEFLMESYFRVRESYLIDDKIKRAERWIEEQKEKKALEAKLSELQPKADYFDELVSRNLLTGIRETAKELKVKEKAFVKFLISENYVYRDSSGKLRPYAEHISSGLFELKEFTSKKNSFAGTQLFITPKGRETFRLLMKSKSEKK